MTLASVDTVEGGQSEKAKLKPSAHEWLEDKAWWFELPNDGLKRALHG
jgi:hypothetical protein